MKVAICGMGLRAANLARIFKIEMPEIEFVGYYDEGIPTLGPIQDMNLTGYDSLEKLLGKTQPDLLFVTSPNHKHLEHIKIGLDAGVQIFCEKPVVTSLEDSFELAKLLKEHGPDRVMIGLVLRYSNHAQDLRAAIESGQIGPIASIDACEYIAPYHGAFFMRDWRRKDEYSGGFILEKCCHDLDFYNMVMDTRPARVASFGGRRSFLPEHAPTNTKDKEIYHVKTSAWASQDDPFNVDGEIVDHQSAIIEYENGACLSFQTNSNVPDEYRHFCIVGANGMAEGDFVRGIMRVTDACSGHRHQDVVYSNSQDLIGSHYGADQRMVRDIAQYLRGERKKLSASIVNGLIAGITALAIDESRHSGRIIELGNYWKTLDFYELEQNE